MAFQSGLNTYLGIGEEGVYGTAVARNRFLTFRSSTLKKTVNKIMSGDLYRRGFHAGQKTQGLITVGGDVVIAPRYSSNGLTRLLSHCLGTTVTTRPDITNAPTVYRHTFTPNNSALPTGLTLEQQTGVQRAFLFTGCKVSSMRFAGRMGEPLVVTATFLGRNGSDSSPGTAISFLDGGLIAASSVGSVGGLTFDGITQKVTEFDLTYSNNLTYINDVASQFTNEPFFNDHLQVTGTFRAYFEDVTLWSYYVNSQRKQLQITLTGDTIAGAYSYDIVLTCPITEFDDSDIPADTAGPIMMSFTFAGHMDDNNPSEISIRITNQNAAA